MKKLFSSNVLNFSIVLVVASLALAACSPATAPQPAAVSKPAATMQQSYSAPVTVEVPVTGGDITINTAKNDQLGTFLVDGKGMTLYLFTKDAPGKSNCSGDCLVKWPPLVASDLNMVKVGPGVDASKLGLADLADGRKIVTYRGMPLYYWVKDVKPGDTTGQNVGKVWFVVSPAGNEAAAAPTMAPAAAANSEIMLNTAKDDKLGTFLVDGKGMTLYLFTKDTPGKSNCAGDCLVKWPPFVATDVKQIKVGTGVDASKLGLADLPDGKKIVTYKGMPLYYWVKDTKPGDTTGQNVGNVWFVVAP
jgi:predicted lipoprotein with Yx(FWY)xxD motif